MRAENGPSIYGVYNFYFQNLYLPYLNLPENIGHLLRIFKKIISKLSTIKNWYFSR